jgi:hypothetical protein
MAHFARVNSENVVIYVTPVSNEMITDENGVEHEEWAFDHLYESIPDSVGDRWIQTSINANFRKHYATVGKIYDESRDAFMAPQPYNSWTLNEETCEWEAPISKPDVEITPTGPFFEWNEELGDWEDITLRTDI